MQRIIFLLLTQLSLMQYCLAQSNHKNKFTVTGYYAGNTTAIDSVEVEKLTHLIYCFCHLNGNKLSMGNAHDTFLLHKMVQLRQKNPALKILVSLGGWGGCMKCSSVFSLKKGRKEFALSVKELIEYFDIDGIDLDWEYPVVEGFPGHPYSPDDKSNFTALVRVLRKTLGNKKEISFAAGGFTRFINESIEWKKVMRKVDRLNLMSYDLIGGYSKVSGHHTPLYSNAVQTESTDNGVQLLLKKGVKANKIVIGAAFYARLFTVTDSTDNGLNRPGNFYRGISWKNLYDTLNTANGFTLYRDTIAHAPYAFNPVRKIFATYDDSLSVKMKAKYTITKKLNGIMFWQLMDDRFSNGLLNLINSTIKSADQP